VTDPPFAPWESSDRREGPAAALVFPDTEPALRFYASNRIDGIENRPADNHHRSELLPLVGARIDAIIEREGAFRLPKSVGWFVAETFA
jgi:hypothetical protein